MSWTKKTYQPKKFRPRQKTNDEVEYQRKIERAREEAKQHALRLETERRRKQIEIEKQEKLRVQLLEIELQQSIIKQNENAAKKYFEDKEILWKHRLFLRKENLKKNKSKTNKNLETKIKKIEGFLKKTKQFEKHSKNVHSLILEMNKLKLGPYIDEVVKDLTNTNISVKQKDEIDKLLHLASALHQRFEQKFTKSFKDGILDAFRPKLDLKQENIRKKQLLNLVILIEMTYCGLFKTNNTLYELLKHIIKTEIKHKDKLNEKIKEMKIAQSQVIIDDNNYKMEDRKNKNEITLMIYEYDDVMIHTLELMTTFSKYSNEECLGSINKSFKKYYDILQIPFKPNYYQILNSKQRKQFIDLMRNYFNKICDKYLSLELKLRKQQKLNNIILMERGSISDSRQEITDKLESVVVAFTNNIQLFVQYLDFAQFPIKLKMENEMVTLNIDGELTSLSDAQNASFFDDEVSRSFYDNLPHLKDNIPGSLLQGDNTIKRNIENNVNIDIENVNITAMPSYLVNIDIDINDDNEDCQEKEEEKEKEINTMKKLLSALQCMGSRKETEVLAEKFCYLNSKNNRRLLASFLCSVTNRDSTRLPFYARFIAILNLSQINIGDRVCLSIEKDFYRLFLSNKKWLIDTKMANLSYIAELTKFEIFSFNALFNILEKLCKRFNNESIELLSFFMFQCGRFLYKNPLTHIRLNKILSYLKRSQIQTNLDAFLTQHISNAIFACKPPEKSALDVVKLTHLQQYIEHLLYFRLNHNNKQSILRKLRKLPWNDDDIKQFMIDRLFNISVVNFEKIDCVAAIIQGLNCYHSISTIIVDSVCEEIRIGLEEEDFTQEQRRISYVKFIGELYTYKAVNSQVIMDTLYLIITYNIDDSTDNTICNFRISLCCMLLEVCGKYLRKGKLKSRCDRFLFYFQRFIILYSPIPFDIEWWVNDVLLFIAPNMTRYYDLEQILERINELESSTMSHKDALLVLEEEEEEEEDQQEEEEEEEQEEEEEFEEEMADVNSYHRKKKITKHDKQFIDEYEKMMEQYRAPNTKKTNINNLKHASVLVNDLEKMGIKNINTDENQESEHEDDNEDDEEEECYPFRLLSKKGASSSKLKIGIIKIPKQVIIRMKSNQKKETVKADKIKSVTLQHLQDFDDDIYCDDDIYEMVDNKNNVIQKHKTKQHSLSAKRKYKQNLKQQQYAQIEDEREKQKSQRDEKRKKQSKYNILQDF